MTSSQGNSSSAVPEIVTKSSPADVLETHQPSMCALQDNGPSTSNSSSGNNCESSTNNSSVSSIKKNMPKTLTYPFVKHSQNIDPFCRNVMKDLKESNSFKMAENVELIDSCR